MIDIQHRLRYVGGFSDEASMCNEAADHIDNLERMNKRMFDALDILAKGNGLLQIWPNTKPIPLEFYITNYRKMIDIARKGLGMIELDIGGE